MINELDTRTQLAHAIKASEQVYLNWLRNYTGGSALVYSDKNYSFHLSAGSLLVLIWRPSGKYPLTSLEFVSKGGDSLIFVSENYFRGVDCDKLGLTNSQVTFNDYLALANNFPEKAVTSLLRGLSEGFEHFGLANDYNYQLTCVE